MPGPVQLKFNLQVAPKGEPLADVAAQASEFKIITSRNGITIPPNGKTARGSTSAGSINEQLQITCHSSLAAASLWATLRQVIYTDTAELDFAGTFEPGPPSPDNPLHTGTAVMLNLETGGAVDALRGQTLTLPITDAGVSITSEPPAWEATTPYVVGDYVAITGGVLQATIAGTSGATEPALPATVDATVVDGTVTWKRVS